MADRLTEALESAKAEVLRIEREIAQGPCREYGHTWKSMGGCNAGCGDDCSCSVPVHKCTKCGDCDYGDNADAEQVIEGCEHRTEWVQQDYPRRALQSGGDE